MSKNCHASFGRLLQTAGAGCVSAAEMNRPAPPGVTALYSKQPANLPAIRRISSIDARGTLMNRPVILAAETALRLVAGAKLDLDAPLAPYWVDFYQPSNDAVIVFLNAPNRRALSAMPDLISLLDSHSPYLSHYRAWLAREVAKERGKASRK
ncbi:MAG: hypothetical protein ABW106_11705 [Steroidobacteraceae bacterium]